MITRRLEGENKHLISLELHCVTLTEYFRVKRIPRGLRTHLHPTLLPHNVYFCRNFEAISNKFSFDIILLNIECLQQEMVRVKQRIIEDEALLDAMLSAQELKDFKDKTTIHLQMFRSDIEHTKKNKWFRDSEDYIKGQVYQKPAPMAMQGNPNRFNRRMKRANKAQNKKKWDTFGFQTAESDSGDDHQAGTSAMSVLSSSASFLGKVGKAEDTEGPGEEAENISANGKEKMPPRQTHHTTKGTPPLVKKHLW